jgi:site-specific DNA recombinase
MLFSVEEKWIKNEINRDTYDRWYSNYNSEIISLNSAVERLGKDHNQAFSILRKNLDLLSDMRYVYSTANTLQKREFVSLVFDNNLYYENGMYRTPTMMEVLAHNSLLMKEKGYLDYKKKEGFLDEIPLGREEEIRTLDTVTRIHTFQACSFNHSDTSLLVNVGAKIALKTV